jgi:hypothetical protein
MTDERQLDRFGEAVERKKREAKEASERPALNPREGEIHQEVQPSVVDDSTNQDVPDPHHKSSRHRKVTAENYNQ